MTFIKWWMDTAKSMWFLNRLQIYRRQILELQVSTLTKAQTYNYTMWVWDWITSYFIIYYLSINSSTIQYVAKVAGPSSTCPPINDQSKNAGMKKNHVHTVILVCIFQSWYMEQCLNLLVFQTLPVWK